MRKQRLGAVMAGFVLMVIAAYVRSDGFQQSIDRTVNEATGWNEEARKEDPQGYLDFVEKRLTQDLKTMQQTRKALAAEMNNITEQEQQLDAKVKYARELADEFRAAWRADRFPVEIRHAAYTRDQTEAQVSILLAQIDGYQDSLEQIESARQQSEMRVEELTVQVVRTETNLALIDTQRELLRARALTTTRDELVAQVDALFTDNRTLLSGSPIRSVEELLETADISTSSMTTSRDRVHSFLAQTGTAAECETVSAE
ncbi:MAG: hypothetical protein KDA85_01375 [Planctomycetaceae bacterium]|nr:hypothetical protein [Planctomycetaceae bacterium]